MDYKKAEESTINYYKVLIKDLMFIAKTLLTLIERTVNFHPLFFEKKEETLYQIDLALKENKNFDSSFWRKKVRKMSIGE